MLYSIIYIVLYSIIYNACPPVVVAGYAPAMTQSWGQKAPAAGKPHRPALALQLDPAASVPAPAMCGNVGADTSAYACCCCCV